MPAGVACACGLALLCALALSEVAAQTPRAAVPDAAIYDVRDDVRVRMRDGGTVSAIVVRRRAASEPLPTLLWLDIYTDAAAFRARAADIAAHGYVGVIADTRGKRLSPDAIQPYEHEAADAHDVIDWIAHQPWSNGTVGMLGGSYSGFTAWAATKQLHPALKTIAVSAAAIPGQGLPMCNNVFLNANYGWAFYVADGKYLDEKVYSDSGRWERLQSAWFASGLPYRGIDAIDGTPNPLLQRWLEHPAYDAYWQAMVPYRDDFAHIDIPVLTITGYYDDGQVSALEYLKEHYRYRPAAEHYLVIGPYDHLATHWSVKPEVLRGYRIDPVAQFSTPELSYQWMDYVLRGGPKPAMLRGRINYEVMGANEWRHAATLGEMGQRRQRLYFSTRPTTGGAAGEARHLLTAATPVADGFLEQRVDLADHRHQNNTLYYPSPIVEEKSGPPTGLVFVSEPLAQPEVVSGAFAGQLEVSINKRDVDLGVTVFEELPDGRLFHLAYWLGRASFAADRTHRRLLTRGKISRIPFETSLVSRLLGKGSRLLVLADVNKNEYAQVNYGTGRDVSDESSADAGAPLAVRWHSGSYLDLPLDQR
ncbi:MAG TPA: CocE/NonD family hydrolase [Steroidobacteraceae bacterium]|jgi:putative CocE/NonD family hydrolase|nr:CocE/NonD family hydrolase [Steroidobacteraceae bacterium]